MQSDMFLLNLKDFGKGAALAVLAAVVTFLYESLSAGVFVTDVNEVARIALTAFVAYLLKNYLSSSNGKFLGRVG